MHEVSIAESIIETLKAEAALRGFTRVNALTIEAGELTGVVPDSLEFAWEFVSKDTLAEGSRLEVRKLPIASRCRDCQGSYEVEGLAYVCPHCGSESFTIVSGKELNIVELDVDEADRTREHETR